MSFLMGSGSKSQQPVRYTGVSVQTSSQGLPIPVLYGRNRTSGNLIWYNDFKSYAQHQGAGKGGGEITSYTYSVAMIMAIGEGPLVNILGVYYNQSEVSLASLNLAFYSGAGSQTPPAFITSTYPGEAESYAWTAYVFSSRLDLGGSANLPSLAFEYEGLLSGTMPGLPDANFADIIYDFVTNGRYGLRLDASVLDAASLLQYKKYCQAYKLWGSPAISSQEQALSIMQRWAQITNSWIFWGGTSMLFVPLGDASKTANGATYTPDLTVQYALTWDNMLTDGQSAPITVVLKNPYDSYNQIQLDCSNRAQTYNTYSATWFDQTSADRFGLQPAQVISCPEICEPTIAQVIAALIGQRMVAVRREFQFTLSPSYGLLQPGDIVSVTDPAIGLSAYLVRIREIEESDEDMSLRMTAEDLALTTGSLQYTPGTEPSTANNVPDQLIDPGDTNIPGIIEPDRSYTGGTANIWVSASGGPEWGGCEVWISFDNLSYSLMGRIEVPSPQGDLTAPLPVLSWMSSNYLDTTSTLSVDLADSDSTLPTTATHDDAEYGRTLCLVGTEIVTYGSVDLGAGPFDFDLTYLERGWMDTVPQAHIVGTRFTRIDPSTVFQTVLSPEYIGVPIWIKLPAFNKFQGPPQSLADVTAHIYVPAGGAFYVGPPQNVTLLSQGGSPIVIRLSWAAPVGGDVSQYEVQLSMDGGASWFVDRVQGGDSLDYLYTPALVGTPYQGRVRAVAVGGQAISDWAYSIVLIPTPPVPVPDIITSPPRRVGRTVDDEESLTRRRHR